MRRKIVGVAGRNGSGKDEVINYLHERCGIVTISAGDIVREIAALEFYMSGELETVKSVSGSQCAFALNSQGGKP